MNTNVPNIYNNSSYKYMLDPDPKVHDAFFDSYYILLHISTIKHMT